MCGDISASTVQIAKNIGYNPKDLEAVPESSILGVGCGTPVNFADIKEGEVVVDIGSGGGIDVLLSANKVKDSGKVIVIDMTDEMLEKITQNKDLDAWNSKSAIQVVRVYYYNQSKSIVSLQFFCSS